MNTFTSNPMGAQRYPNFCLSTGVAVRCTGHVPELPGCIARALSRVEVVRKLPEAIQKYYMRLLYHGGSVPLEEEQSTRLVKKGHRHVR